MFEERGSSEPDRANATRDGPDGAAVVRELCDRIPFRRAHDTGVPAVTPRRAETRSLFDESLVDNPDLGVLHGGVVGSLLGLTGAAVRATGTGVYRLDDG